MLWSSMVYVGWTGCAVELWGIGRRGFGPDRRARRHLEMKDFVLHGDSRAAVSTASWPDYFAALRQKGVFQGESAIGVGEAVRKSGDPGTSRANYKDISASEPRALRKR